MTRVPFTPMAAAVLALALAAATTPAYAHAHLKSASPAVGSTAASAPTEVALGFTEALEPRFSTLEVQDAAGADVVTGSPHLAAGDATRFSVGVKPLTPGTYTVIWHATAVDTHKTEGRFQFTIAP